MESLEDVIYIFFYKITNLLNGRYYFGVHKTYFYDDNYMGSSVELTADIKIYGLHNFKKEILKYFPTYKSALEYESFIVNKDVVSDPMSYNKSSGGSGAGCGYKNCVELNPSNLDNNRYNFNPNKRISHKFDVWNICVVKDTSG